MKRKYLAFDVETAKVQPADERDWKAYRPLRISCAATFLEDSDAPVLWHGITQCDRPARRMVKDDAVRLVKYLAVQVRRGYTIVTWNGVGFDFDILAEESGMRDECGSLASGHVDMMFHVLCKLGYGVSLDSSARGMGIPGKCAGLSGMVVPKLWAEGRRQEVLTYVAQDVRTTLQLAKRCEASGRLRWVTRCGSIREVRLPRGWLLVRSAIELPETNATWMRNQWSRKTFTAWLR